MIGRLKFEIDPLVNEMLNKLPADVWSSNSTTFLDLAIGGGQFVKEIERRLRKAGHSDENIASRVFGFEKDILAIRFAVNKYKLVGTYMADKNVLTRDFKGKQFDVVIGNPPYSKKVTARQGITGNGGSIIWPEFVYLAFDLCRPDGYVGLIHPPIWRKPNHKLLHFLQQKNMKFLRILSLAEGQSLFGASTAADCYVAQNNCESGETEIVSATGKGNRSIRELLFIGHNPKSRLDRFFETTIQRDILFSGSLFYSRKALDQPSEQAIEAYYSEQGNTIQTKFFERTEAREQFLVPKVIVQMTGHKLHTVVDDEGRYGICQFSCGIPISSKQEGEQIAKWLHKHEEALQDYQWGMTRAWRLFAYLKPNFWRENV